jgi:S-DNA-T family DNA segregation ATPase FtsK/SpoIIIE
MESPRLINDRARRDIAGITFIVCGIVLFIMAVAPADAFVTQGVSHLLLLTFGVGAYLVPLSLIAVGGAILYRKKAERISLRVAVGLLLVLVAFLGLVALFTPLPHNDFAELFDPAVVVSQGGFVGAALAWVGMTLFGSVITGILLVGLAIVGIVIIGFSLSAFVEKVRLRYEPQEDRGESSAANGFFGFNFRGRGDTAAMGQGSESASSFGKMNLRNGQGEGAYANEAGSHMSGGAMSGTRGAHGAQPTMRMTFTEPVRRRKTVAMPTSGAETQVLGDASFDVAGGASAQPTQVLGAQGASAEARATTGSGTSSSQKTRVLSSAGSASAPTNLTRKLGKKNKPAPAEKPTRSRAKKAPVVPVPNGEGFQLPPMDLLMHDGGTQQKSSDAELSAVAAELQATLEDFGVMAEVVDWVEGPTVTLFSVDLPSGVRVSKVTNLTDDIALALAAPGVRIFAPIPGTNYVGIEVPNRRRRMVYLPDVLKAAGPGPLQVAIGEDVEGHAIVSDLATMPHVLIAGTTGSGKSVEVNGMIMSILMRATPDEVRFIMIDPKRVEFAPYDGIPHLYAPVVTECRDASNALSWAVAEMEKRLKMFSKCGVRNIVSFNEKARKEEVARRAAEEKGTEPPELIFGEPIPYIVIVIDELADLMMNVGKEVEFSISRIAQLARAAGIHLIIATQRPSTNVVTGLIKANITCRIGLTVASGIDSRVILDSTGAENLIGHGDLLISKPEYPKPVRVQGPYVSDDEIASVVTFLKAQGEPDYHDEIFDTNVITIGSSSPSGDGGSGDDDPLVWEAADIVVSSNLGSTSNLQRRLKVGYARAGRIMDQLEEKGIVGPANGSRPREVLVDQETLETLRAFEMHDKD